MQLPSRSCRSAPIGHGRLVPHSGIAADAITTESGKARFVAADLNNTVGFDELVDQVGVVDICNALVVSSLRSEAQRDPSNAGWRRPHGLHERTNGYGRCP